MWSRDKSSGGLVYLNYTGIINITPALGAILGGSPDAKSTPFGDSCECRSFCWDDDLTSM